MVREAQQSQEQRRAEKRRYEDSEGKGRRSEAKKRNDKNTKQKTKQ